ncbi:MAG: NAD(P)H-dependent oxidoreductase subunit E [Fibrobacter sp.]|jgi:NADH-quinone oxidoreductase E subunit|nr:NAD(P)H-dependent oxidoreductase subunit E [Fibrobacter sp.]
MSAEKNLHIIANNRLRFTEGPKPYAGDLPAPAEQVGHLHESQKQPSWNELAPLLENEQVKLRVADLLSRYPDPQGALLEVLWIAQEVIGWVPREAIRWAASVCSCSPAHALGVATFYTMYKHAPTGRFLLQFCRNMCCSIRGASDIIRYAENALGIKTNGTTPDGLFTLIQVECLGACGNGPVMLVNDDFATDVESGELTLKKGAALTPDRVDRIIAWCRDRASQMKEEPVRDALGGKLSGHLGHPGAPGASARAQVLDYAPPPPVLGVSAQASADGVTLTWKAAPEITALAVERLEDSSWKQIGTLSPKDKEFKDASGKAGMDYRMTASSGDRAAKPSAAVKATEKAG